MFRTFDPFRELDRLAARGTFPPGRLDGGLPYDTLQFDDRVELRFDVPGIDPESIDLTVDHRELTLTVERSNDVPEGATVVARHRPTGKVTQRLHLGESLDADGLDARYDNGVLTVVIPVAESAQPRRIAIGAAGSA